MRKDKETPNYYIGTAWPEDNNDDILLEFDLDAPPFHIGQSYDEKKAQQIKCHKCGCTEFNVAQGNYYTAIRCSSCEWECCIHEG